MGREVYGALVRFAGTVLFGFGLINLAYLLGRLASLGAAPGISLSEDVLGVVFYLMVGVGLVRGAGWIERLVYGRAAGQPSSS